MRNSGRATRAKTAPIRPDNKGGEQSKFRISPQFV